MTLKNNKATRGPNYRFLVKLESLLLLSRELNAPLSSLLADKLNTLLSLLVTNESGTSPSLLFADDIDINIGNYNDIIKAKEGEELGRTIILTYTKREKYILFHLLYIYTNRYISYILRDLVSLIIGALRILV